LEAGPRQIQRAELNLNALRRMRVRVVDVETRPRFALSAKRRDCRRQRSGVSRTSSAIVRASNSKSALMQAPERLKASARKRTKDSHFLSLRAYARNRSRSRELLRATECAEAKPRRRTPAASEDSRCQAGKRMPPTCYARFWLKRRLAGKKDLARARAILSGGALPIPPGAAFRRAALSGVSGEWVAPARSATGPVLLYLHGGGYFTGCARAHRPITASFATAGFNVFVPEYRLAPEYPYPAAVDDVEGVWNGLLESGHPASSITISGDSAGGGLALALMLRLREKRKPLPAAAALFSPWTDLADTGESLLTNARRDAVFGAREIRIAADWYLNGAEPQTPEASPLYALLDGLPPLFIEVGERESLLDDRVASQRVLKLA
jgi:acetyl esterase/lipase